MNIVILLVCFSGLTPVMGQLALPVYYNTTQYEDRSIGLFEFLNLRRSRVTYRVWTRKQNYTGIPLKPGLLYTNSHIKRSQPFKFIVHGYLDSPLLTSWMHNMKNEYLIKGDYNVIMVNWIMGAFNLYPISARYTQSIGNYIGEIWKELNETMAVPLSKIHCIGHSLGAQICGFAGKYTRITGKRVHRISGMDPAGPLFRNAIPEHRLNRTDADMVDIYHTDDTGYGMKTPLGHYDFYINGGIRPQPGCYTFTRLRDIILGCSHKRAFIYFTESINSKRLKATNCKDLMSYQTGQCQNNVLIIMGDSLRKNVDPTGVYQMSTNARPPYGRDGQV